MDDRGTYTGRELEGRYKLLRPLGMGGMGEVYLGRHMSVGRKVAVKILKSVFTRDESIVKRFYREAQAAASIKHKNIIDVLDVGVSEQGDPFIVMEYLEGESLGDLLIRSGPQELAMACGVMEPALEAIQVAHEAGIVHRDLKPDNIFLSREGRGAPVVKLIDFGISKLTTADKETRLTADGSLLGTPSYMSPEQSRGKRDIDGRADIYSMGVILYEMLTGELPFDGDNYNAILIASLTEPPRKPSEVYAGFPFVAEAVVMKSLEKRREDRYQSATEMLSALRDLEDFAERENAMANVGRAMKRATFAVGDLGSETTTLDVDTADAAEVLSDMLKEEGTPRAWAGTEERRIAPKKQGHSKGKIAVLAASIPLVLALGAFGILYALGFFGAAEVVEPRAPKLVENVPIPKVEEEPLPADAGTEKQDGVRITVEGLPQGAKLYFDDVLIPMNPFRVERRDTIASLKVEADGYESFAVAVVPSEDRLVEVSLKKSKKWRPPKAGAKDTGKLPGPIQEIGKLARAQADKVYHSKKGQLVQCYNKALSSGEATPDKPINLKLKIGVNPSGSVGNVGLAGAGSYPGLNTCIRSSVKTWVFPPTPKGGKEVFPIAFTTN